MKGCLKTSLRLHCNCVYLILHWRSHTWHFDAVVSIFIKCVTAAEFLDMIHSLITQCLQMSMGKYSIQGNEESKVASKIKRKLINEENSG